MGFFPFFSVVLITYWFQFQLYKVIFCGCFSCISLSSGPEANNSLLCYPSVSVAIQIQFWGQLFTGAVLHPPGWFLPSAQWLQLQRPLLPAAYQRHLTLPAGCLQIVWVWVFLIAQYVISFIDRLPHSPVPLLAWWLLRIWPRAGVFILLTASPVQIWWSRACFSLSAWGKTCHRELWWYKASGVQSPFLRSLSLPLLLALRKGRSASCSHVYLRPMTCAMQIPTEK